jgi:hypothetical protein
MVAESHWDFTRIPFRDSGWTFPSCCLVKLLHFHGFPRSFGYIADIHRSMICWEKGRALETPSRIHNQTKLQQPTEIIAMTKRLLEIIAAQQVHHVFHRKRRKRALVFRDCLL